MAFSIQLDSENFYDVTPIHASLSTFLRQVNHLQICNQQVANTFIGGKKDRVIPFFQQVHEMPRLERYIDAYLTMLEFAPEQEWFVQVDEGIHI